MIPWEPLLIFAGISVGTTTVIAVVCASMGWTVDSPAWTLLVPVAMWAPAFGRMVTRRVADTSFTATLPIRRWGVTGAQVVLWPLAVPLVVYGAAYAIAWYAGVAHWSPGGGKWTSGPQIAANLLVNLSILGVFGTFTAMGEELGWRGYLQPRLDAAGVRASVIVVWLCQLAYHAPIMVGAGYVAVGGFFMSFALFAMLDLPVTFIIAREAYRARSLWPAVFFHSFHNTISQWLFPSFFTVGDNQFWLQGETGLLPVAGYAVLGASLLLWVRRHGPPWQALARSGLETG
jgi:membrane protease YdiL (CAAX protease family)